MSEWSKYTCRDNAQCHQFKYVAHTSHIGAAANILNCGEIRQSLVFDESKLNNKRILVSWLSPNVWNTGYRYGTVRFKFDFAQLIKDKKYYWVEAGKYKIPAPRILITDTNNDYHLEEYDATTGEGPWWYKSDEDAHYFNHKVCLEIMIEGSVSLNNLIGIEFVQHHDKYCSLNRMNPKNCDEIDLLSAQSMGKFLATTIATKVDLSKYQTFLKAYLGMCYYGLIGYLDNAIYTGSLKHTDAASKALVVSLASAIAFNRLDDALMLASMFADANDLLIALAEYCKTNIDNEVFTKVLGKITTAHSLGRA